MLSRNAENPLLEPDDIPPSHGGFEVHGVFNAGATLVGGKTVLILRISERAKARTPDTICTPWMTFGSGRARLTVKKFSRNDRRYDFSEPAVVWETGPEKRIVSLTSLSHLRLAWSDDGVRFRVAKRPWLFPRTREEAWGCEDARVTRVGATYYVNYTAVSSLGITTALATTTTFQQATRHGILFAPANRDVTIFPQKIGGLFACFHRPMPSYIGEAAIWYATSPDGLRWGAHRFVAGPRPGHWDGLKIGGGAPPIRTKDGWLAIYHGVDARQHYSLGALLTDLNQPWKVRARSRQPLLSPTTIYERKGFVPNICFTCGVIERAGNLRIYYGAADRVLALAEIPLREALRRLRRV